MVKLAFSLPMYFVASTSAKICIFFGETKCTSCWSVVGHVSLLNIICDNFLFLQGEMQQLRDKLAVAERTARSEAQLKVYNLFVTVEQPGCLPAF